MNTLNQMNYNNKSINKILGFLIAASPILDVYTLPSMPIGMGSISLMVFIPFVIKYTNFALSLRKFQRFLLFCVYCIFISLLIAIIEGFKLADPLIRVGVMLYYVAIVFVFSSVKDNQMTILRSYMSLAIFSSIIIVFQFVIHYILGTDIFFILKGVPLNQSTISTYSQYVEMYSSMYSYSFRPTSLFLEPAHYALYVSPAIVLFLRNYKYHKQDLWKAILVSLGILVSTAMTGYLFLAVAWCSLFFDSLKRQKWNTLILILIVGCIGFILFSRTEYYSTFWARISQLSSHSKGSSIEVRLLHGFDVFSTLGIEHKLLGIGLGNFSSYSLASHYFDSIEYMSSISYILVSGGVVGFILFALSILKIFHYFSVREAKIIFIQLIVAYCVGSTLFSLWDTFIIIVCMVLNDNITNEENLYKKGRFYALKLKTKT